MLCFRLQHIYFVALYGLFFPDSKSRNEEIMAFDGVTIAVDHQAAHRAETIASVRQRFPAPDLSDGE